MHKIIFFIRSLNAGGAERQLLLAAKGLADREFEVVVLTFYADGFYEQSLAHSNIRLISLNKKGRWDLIFFVIRFVKVLKNEHPALIYSYMSVANILSLLVKFILPKTPVVWGVRATKLDFTANDWLSNLIYKLEGVLAKYCDAAISNSHAGMSDAVAQGFCKERMSVIGNGIDSEYFSYNKGLRDQFRKLWQVSDDQYLVGLIGRLEKMKNQLEFLKTVVKVREYIPNLRVVFVGVGSIEYKVELVQQIQLLALDECIIFADIQTNMPAVYSAIDMFCSASCYGEGFSNALAEAMSCGVPCIATDVGDAKYILGDCGVIVAPDDDNAMAKAVVNLASQKRTDIALKNRYRISCEFTVEKMLDDTAHRLKVVLENAPKNIGEHDQ